MKLTILTAIFTLAVVLQQMESPMALSLTGQGCGYPKCSSGLVDTNQCKCSSTYPSTCKSGFKEIMKPHGLCACEQKTKPECPAGFSINSLCTQCRISITPKCPSGSKLSPYTAKCEGIAEPKCPSGFIHHGGCNCVKEYIRQCPSGGTLSWDGCRCTGGTSKPKCGSGCYLNWSSCSCNSIGGGGDECCSGGICYPCIRAPRQEESE